MLTRWIEAKPTNFQQQSTDSCFHQTSWITHWNTSQGSYHLHHCYIAQQLELQLTLICSSKPLFQLSSLEEELLPKKKANSPKHSKYRTLWLKLHFQWVKNLVSQHTTMSTTYQHRTIWSRMEFFLMPSYLFLSLSEEGLLSFYIAKIKEKGEGETCSQPGAELLRAPPPLGRASGEARWGWSGPSVQSGP